MIDKIGVFLITAAVWMWALGHVPQILRTRRLKTTEDISLGGYLLAFAAYISYVVGLGIRGDWFLLMCELVPTIFCGFLICQILYYRRRETND